MSGNLVVKQKLIDQIESLSEDQIINVLEFLDTLAKSKSNSQHLAYKSWQPADPYDAIWQTPVKSEFQSLIGFPINFDLSFY